LLAHYHSQNPQYTWDVFGLHVAVLLLVETVEDLTVFFDQLGAHSWLELGSRLLLDLGRSALHYITANLYKQARQLVGMPEGGNIVGAMINCKEVWGYYNRKLFYFVYA
jgi:hypothetical protein